MALFEERSLNHSLWECQTSWTDFRLEVHDMDFCLGIEPDSRTETGSDLLDTITGYWGRNSLRPSNTPWFPQD